MRWPAAVAIALGLLASCGGIVAPSPGDGGPSATGSSSGAGSSSGIGPSSSASGSGSGGASSSASGGSSGGGDPVDAGLVIDTGTDDAGDVSVGPGCGAQPALHPMAPGSIFCGFGAQAALVCQTGQQCCLGGPLGGGMYAADQCSAWTAAGTGCDNPATGAIGIACNQVSDCAANGQEGTIACCLQGATGPFVPPTCPYFKATGGTAVVCEDNGLAGNGVGTCAAGEVQICAADADCPAGMQCIAGKWKIFQVGFCM